MPFIPFVTGAVELSINTLINKAPDISPSFTRLKGKVLSMHLQETGQNFIFIFSQQVDVLSQYEGDIDCYVSLKLSSLPQLKNKQNITQLIKEDKLVVEGDIQLLQQFSELLEKAKPDAEETLSYVMGDVLSHIVVDTAKSTAHCVSKAGQAGQKQLSKAIIDEWQILPAPLEVAYFCDQVTDLEQDMNALLKRFEQLTGY